MDQSETVEPQVSPQVNPLPAWGGGPAATLVSPVFLRGHEGNQVFPQLETGTCRTCGGGQGNASLEEGASEVSFVYAMGRVEARFPSMSLEREFAQAVGRAETVGMADREVLASVLSHRQNRYLARQICWVLTIEGLETYLLVPRVSTDLELLLETLRPVPSPTDLDIVIGALGPLAPPQMCNGLLLPMVAFDQVYSFDRDALIQSIPCPEKIPAREFTAAAAELLDRILLMADNAGAADEHRVLNYLAVRYPAIYAHAAEQYGRNSALTSVDVRPSRLSGVRKIMDVIFAFTQRQTDVTEKYFVRVDVTEEFPFMVTKLSPYYDFGF